MIYTEETRDKKLIIEPIWDYEWYYFVPVLDRDDWDGIEYDSVKYGWEELDYRFGVDYNSTVPEPNAYGFILGLILLVSMFAYKWTKKFM